jgi:hypothetical protein
MNVFTPHRVRQIAILIVIGALGFVFYHQNSSAPTNLLADSQSRIAWASSLSHEDDELQFTAVGPSSRTLLVVIYPRNRVDESALESKILYDSSEVEFRKILRTKGFQSIQVGVENDPTALPNEAQDSHKPSSSAVKKAGEV